MDTLKRSISISSHEAEDITSHEAEEIAKCAYIFGYPLVLMNITKQTMIKQTPINQFYHMREFPTDGFTDVVSPNVDTLYSMAWLDLLSEPIILSVPKIQQRYYLMELLDAWTNVFASISSRTIGIGPGDFAIIGPSWNGKLPQGIKEYKSPTNMVWIIGRTQTNYNDISSVHAIQDQYKLTLLSDWSNSYVPSKNVAPVTKKDDESDKPPVQQIADLDTSTFFNYLNTLMVNNPPADADANAMKLFSQICVAPGQHFDLTHFSNDVAEAIKRGACEGLNKITSTISSGSINNWSVMIDNMGQYGTDYLFRAYVAFMGLGANLPKDAVYASCRIDHDGNQLTGKNKNRYTISFARGETPPVKAFWSLTMYNDQQFFVSNKLSCYALGSRDDLKYNSDGSLTFYLQNDEPDNSEMSNWLPAPESNFNIMLRMYWPTKEVLKKTWSPPYIEKAH